MQSRPRQVRTINNSRDEGGVLLVELGAINSSLVRVPPRNTLERDQSSFGLYYGRVLNAIGDNGEVVAGDTLFVMGGANVKPERGARVLCKRDAVTGYYRMFAYASDMYNNVGIDSRAQTEPINTPRLNYVRNLYDGKFVPYWSATDTYSTKLERYGDELLGYEGTLRQLNRGSALAVDLSAYVPTAGNEAYVLLYDDMTDGSVGVVSTTPTTIAGTKPTMTTIQGLIDDLPHQLALPAEVWRLADAQTAITQDAFTVDLRQWRNNPLPPSFAPTLQRNWIIPPAHQQIVCGTVTVPDGNTLIIGDGAELIIEPCEPIYNYKTVTTDYTIKPTDDWVRVDASAFAITITLPPASDFNGRVDITAYDVSGGSITVDGNGAEMINGSLTQVLTTQYDSLTIRPMASEWIIT